MTVPHALIIDDNQHNIDVLTMLLQHEGASYTACQSVTQVADTLDQINVVNVVFLDLEFPNGDGFSLLKTLRLAPQLQGVPIVAYSVHTSEIDLARRAGFDGFLGKPLSASLFSEQLKRILSGNKVWTV